MHGAACPSEEGFARVSPISQYTSDYKHGYLMLHDRVLPGVIRMRRLVTSTGGPCDRTTINPVYSVIKDMVRVYRAMKKH